MMRRWLLLPILALCGAANAAELEARMQWPPSVTLSTPVDGLVAEVKAGEGQALKRGELLLALDPRPFRIELARRRAELERFEARFGEAEREWERAQELFDRTLISDHDLELARISFAEAEAERAILTAARQQAELALEYSRLKAPFDAWLLKRHVEPGELVVNGERAQPLLEIVPSGRMVAEVYIDETVGVGERLGLRHDGREIEGRIIAMGLDADENGRRRVLVEFMVGKGILPGGTVTVLLP